MPTDEEVVATINEMVESGELIEETDEHDHIVYRLAPKAEVNGVNIFDPSRALDRAIVMVQELTDEVDGKTVLASDGIEGLFAALKKIMYALKQEADNKTGEVARRTEEHLEDDPRQLQQKRMDPIDAMTKAITLIEHVKNRVPEGSTGIAWLQEAQSEIRFGW